MLHTLILPDGSEISSGAGAASAIAAIRLTQRANTGTQLTLGSVCAAKLEADIITPRGSLTLCAGDRVTLLAAGEPVGVFILEKPTRPNANALTITGYDPVSKLDKELAPWLNSLSGWPYKLSDLAKLVAIACGVNLSEPDMPNGSFPVEKFTLATVTGRQLMRRIGELAGRFLRARPDGWLEFAAYKPGSVHLQPTGADFYYLAGLRYDDYRVAKADAVRLKLTDGSFFPETGEGNFYTISGTPLIANCDEAVSRAFATLAAQIPYGYTPCSVSCPERHDIQPGDAITVTDRNGRTFETLVMEKTVANGRMTLSCTGSTVRSVTEERTLSEILAQQQKYADGAAQEAVQKLSQEEVFNKLTNNGQLQGFYIQDGKLYINAEFVQILNLVAQAFRAVSQNGSTVLEMDAADGEPDIRLYENYEGSTVRRHQAVITPAVIRLAAAASDGLPTGAAALQLENGLGCVYLDTLYPTGAGNCKWEYLESIGKTVLVKA